MSAWSAQTPRTVASTDDLCVAPRGEDGATPETLIMDGDRG